MGKAFKKPSSFRLLGNVERRFKIGNVLRERCLYDFIMRRFMDRQKRNEFEIIGKYVKMYLYNYKNNVYIIVLKIGDKLHAKKWLKF